MRNVIFTFMLLLFAPLAMAQGWSVEWTMLDAPLDSICAGSGHPLADGTIVNIYHDANSDGPDDTDPLLALCSTSPCSTGTANYNSFVVNGGDVDLGVPGGFLSGWAPNNGYILTYIGLPTPNRIYLRVCFGGRRYVSIIYTFSAGSTNDVNMALTDWTCENLPCPGCEDPPQPTNFRASDSTSCSVCSLRWHYPNPDSISGQPVDSVFIYRDFALIGGVRSRDTVFVDNTVSQVGLPPYVFNYYVKARRNCGPGNYGYSSSTTNQGSLYPLPPAVTMISASDTICGLVRITWSYSISAGLDSFFIKRNGTQVGGVGRWENEFYHYTYDTTRGGYSVVGWSRVCHDEGTPSEVEPGQALACIPITEKITNSLPASCHLYSNYPNPFNSGTQISFDLPRAAAVSLTVFNVAGQRVATLVNGMTEAGNHTVRFDGIGFPSGVYFVRMEAGSWTSSRKMLLLK